MRTMSQQIENFNKEQKLHVRESEENSRVGKHNYWIKKFSSGTERIFEQGEEGIKRLEDRSIEMIQSKKQEEKWVKKNELKRFRELWGTPKNTSICIMEVPGGQGRDRKG